MFQTFSGSSRKPRQVNLSGQNPNPFAASSWNSSASAAQKTLAHAQQEREQRQKERERLNASKKIQRVWRGHKVRTELADARRRQYHLSYTSQEEGPDAPITVEQLQLLFAFCSPDREDDIAQLTALGRKLVINNNAELIGQAEYQPYLPKLAKLILSAVMRSLPSYDTALFKLLLNILVYRRDILSHISIPYYNFLSAAVVNSSITDGRRAELVSAVLFPLEEPPLTPADSSISMSLDIYSAMAFQFLTTPNLETRLGDLQGLASKMSGNLLATAIVRDYSNISSSQSNPEAKLWLLAHFIATYHMREHREQEVELLRALSLQLTACSVDIIGKIDGVEPISNTSQKNESEETGIHLVRNLPTFISSQLMSLVNKASIVGLLERFNIDYAKRSTTGQEDASFLASYALTLLRIFPHRADEIRMWLCSSSMTASNGDQVLALKFFWQAMSSTSTFKAIVADSKAALEILRYQKQHSNEPSQEVLSRNREWRTILLFLELYTFVLKFIDDEDFLGGSMESSQASGTVSKIRGSALPLESVEKLTLFLKNISFTTYYNAAELSTDDKPGMEDVSSTYISINNQSGKEREGLDEGSTTSNSSWPFAGISGMTFYYMRTIVIGVMRMIYERDSRRQFLPKDHWLMTTRFDMKGFIVDVIKEQERRQEVVDGEGTEDEIDEDAEEFGRVQSINIRRLTRPHLMIQQENFSRQQRKIYKRKLMATVGPRIEVLENMPFVIPFETRVEIFRQFVMLDQLKRRAGVVDPDLWRMRMEDMSHTLHAARLVLGRHYARIRRESVFEDAFEAFYPLSEGLKEPIQITFIDSFGTAEAGIDGGGVTKEFLTSATNEAFRGPLGYGSRTSLFVTNDQNLLYPNPTATEQDYEFLRSNGITETNPDWKAHSAQLRNRMQFLGRIVGKCLYEGILVDINFAGFFLLKWSAAFSGSEATSRGNLNDLRDLDEGLYQGLLKLKNYPGNVEDFSLDFTITDTIPSHIPGGRPKIITRDLMPNGSNIPVTNENRLLYIAYVVRHRLHIQPYELTQAFLRGLGQIINPSWLSMFNQVELQTLISGETSEINIDDLRRNTRYGGVYEIGDDGLEHPTVMMFWQVMKEFEDEDRRKVLKYVTSTPRAPLLGFSSLVPRFSIRDGSLDEKRLPSASTCVNLLKLPRYQSKEKLKEKLLYAINAGAGFDLS
ncbi:hypothetical protein sscle_03g027680 [Sclerotinia sclerotiorum 1980 UF-70]|uniref:HECT-type E3 ubiquitin transferase n=1 Tax=Sclerotinia sclerotiorum (strain ATCC 18683 / 1980 / Ss-1) TaxID=665079 RepID=A0A1D9PZ46_SCLS1|nr:hypothetical protein sscle_03g027680 [Sclerotinia sclerotiorum 1980 UF-70]